MLNVKVQFPGLAGDIDVGENLHTHRLTHTDTYIHTHGPITKFSLAEPILSSSHSSLGEINRDTISFLSHLPGLLVGQAQATGPCQQFCP